MTKADPVNPERVLFELNSRFPADGRLAVDVGSSVYWYARQLRLPLGVPAHLSSTLASMGCSVPYGIAAKLDQPGSPVLLVSGDGAIEPTRRSDGLRVRLVGAVVEAGSMAGVAFNTAFKTGFCK